jgi:DNA-binding winged helix-turn-helix (wHTH) protein
VEHLAWRFGCFTLFADPKLLLSEGMPVRVGGRALDILVALVELAGQFVTREELLSRTWGGRVVEEINLRVHMAALRRILGDHDRVIPHFICNVPAKGYCFVAPVVRSSDAPIVETSRSAPLPLPAATELIGRESTIAELVEELQASRIVTIVGPGGIGKSAVVRSPPGLLASRYTHGICLVDLGGIASAETAARQVAEALKCSADVSPKYELLAKYLRHRQHCWFWMG